MILPERVFGSSATEKHMARASDCDDLLGHPRPQLVEETRHSSCFVG